MEKDNNSLRTAELSAEQNASIADTFANYPMAPPIPVPYVKPLDRVRQAPPKKRSRQREER